MNNIKIELERTVPIKHFQSLIRMGVEEKHDEFYSVLILANELKRPITSKDISKNLLINFPEKSGDILFDTIVKLKLIDVEGNITKSGIEALSSHSILIPERDVYDIYCVKDPLVPQILLDYTSIKRKNIEREILREKTEKKNIEKLPEWLMPIQNEKIKIYNKKKNIHIFNIDEKGILFPSKHNQSLTISLTIDRNGNKMEFSGYSSVTKEIPNDLSFDIIWPKILGSSANFWEYIFERDKFALKISYNELNEYEKVNFVKNLKIEKPIIENYGRFDTTVVKNVPIAPKRTDDAQKWFEWFLMNNLSEYIPEQKYQLFLKTNWKKFPEFSNDLRFPTQKELIEKIKDIDNKKGIREHHSRKFWYLQTPLDLLLRE